MAKKKTFKGKMVVHYDIEADSKEEAEKAIDFTHFNFTVKPGAEVKNTDIKKQTLIDE